jgi:site-specific DNA recombinase
VPDVHPNIAEHYRAKVIRLAETLAEPESNGEAREDIRSLIGEVVITYMKCQPRNNPGYIRNERT